MQCLFSFRQEKKQVNHAISWGDHPVKPLAIGTLSGVDCECYQNTMKSRKNLTRFTYKNAAFQGWRLCLSRHGVTFVRYFPDRRFGSGRKSLAAAEAALALVRQRLTGVGKDSDGKLPAAVVEEVERILNDSVPKEPAQSPAATPMPTGRKTSQLTPPTKLGLGSERIKTPA